MLLAIALGLMSSLKGKIIRFVNANEITNNEL
jgi:hypothetical protein